MAQARNWCITLNRFDFAPAELPPLPYERYVVWQLEVAPTTGRQHLQIYYEATRPVRLQALQATLPGIHAEPRRGAREQARDYCMKADSRQLGPWERGVFETQQGRRSDLDQAIDTLKNATPSKRMRRVAEKNPGAYVKYSRGLRDLADELEELPRDDAFVPRTWQKNLMDLIFQPADDRTIYWVTDVTGGKGKSRLCRHLIFNHGAIELSGRVQDMMYAYNKEKIVVFDISRAAAEHSDHLYTMAEKLKNGSFLSTKYTSKLKVFPPPQVIFFSNQTWERSKWSQDRVQEITL